MAPSARRCVALLTSVAVLGSPAAALGQGAGDEQYEDPLAGQTQPKPVKKPAKAPTTTQQLSSSMPTTTQAAQAAAPASAASGTASEPAAASLPRTGSEAWLLAALGVALLLTGIGLRLRTVDGRV